SRHFGRTRASAATADSAAVTVALPKPRRSHPFDFDGAEQAVRFHHQDQHEHHEGHHRSEAHAQHRIDEAGGQVFEDPDEQPADHGSRHAVKAPDDDGREDEDADGGEALSAQAGDTAHHDAGGHGAHQRDAP